MALTPPGTATTRRSVQRIARECVPALADFCIVHLFAGTSMPCVAGAHTTSDGTRHIRALLRSHRVERNDPHSTVAHVVRTKRAMLRTGIQPETLQRRTSHDEDEFAELHRLLAPRSALVVPIMGIVSRTEAVLGVLTLCYSHSGRSYAPGDIPAARRRADQIARVLQPAGPAADSPRDGAPERAPGQRTLVRRRLPLRH